MVNELLEAEVDIRLARFVGVLPETSVTEASADECRPLAERMSDAFVVARWSGGVAPLVLRRVVEIGAPNVEAVDVQDDVDGEGSIRVGIMVRGAWHYAQGYEGGITPEVQETALNVARIAMLGKRGW